MSLTRRVLPARMRWVLAAGCAGVLVLLFVASGQSSLALFAVLLVLLFSAVLGLASWRVEGYRRAKDRVATCLVYSCFGLAVLPLVAVLGTTAVKGVAKLDPYFLTHSMRGVGARDDTGGAYHAIVGTVEQVLLASVIAVPLGLLTAVYLAEYGRGLLAKAVTFFVDVMTGVPSIVAGLFVYTLWILTLGFDFMGWAGAMALSILMLPVVVRSAEEMLKLVPDELREASLALGVPRWRTILQVVLPTALTGIVTGVMLAVARVIGETAPLLLTTFFTSSINENPFDGPQVALPQYVFNEIRKGLPVATERAWAGALTLILIVMLLNLVARLVARASSINSGR